MLLLRGRNITIGAVVGMLLSCTTVMGEDNYLWIRENSGATEFNTQKTTDKEGTGGNWTEKNPYEENSWNENTNTYINNMTLSSSKDNGYDNYGEASYGVKLAGEDLSGLNFINNGYIKAFGGSSQSYGIDIYGNYYNDKIMESIVNNGRIIAFDYGINVDNGEINSIFNDGQILGSLGGISYVYSMINLISNSGVVCGAIGIEGNESTRTDYIFNNGIISGNEQGMYFEEARKLISNNGIIFGLTNAIYNTIYNLGPIDLLNNYGILATEGSEVIYNPYGITITSVNKGLAFKINNGNYTAETDDFDNFGETYDEEIIVGYEKGNDGKVDSAKPIKHTYTIINAKATGIDKDNITGTESITIKNGSLSYDYKDNTNGTPKTHKAESVILNGITDTLKVSGRGNELSNSIVNAYGAAVVMDENMSTITLNNTVVNGGISNDGSTVNITGNGNTLTLQENSIVNSNDVAISVGGKNNAVTLEGNAKVNGKMESTGSNTLNLYGKTDGSMNMLNDISGFVNMNIDKNVTFFEDVKVTGTDTVTVYNTGVLNLRLKKTEDITRTVGIPKAIHAFSGTDGMKIKGTSAEEAGTLNFITNGIGKEIIVDMENIELENMKIKTSSVIDKVEINKDYIHLGAGSDLNGIVNPKISRYDSFNGIYKSLYNSTDENIDALRNILSMTFLGENYDYNNGSDEEQLKNLMSYLGSIYTETPYSYSSELSRRSMGMFRDIVTENHFRPDLDKWLIMGGLTHADGGTKDTYYGQNYHGFDTGTSDVDVDMKLTGAYALGKYGYSENVSLGVAVGGNRSKAEMSMSKVKGNSGYIGAFAEKYRGNLTLKAGAGIQYSEYDADRRTVGENYSEKYSDMTYDIYLNGRYSHQVGENLFLEPYGTLSYTYIDQDGANEGSKTLAIETDSKSFDYTTAKVGADLKKVIPHKKGKSTLSAGVSYTRILNGAEKEHITGRFKGGSDFDILVARKNEQSIGLNAKYALELENGILFDVKGTYAVERDSHNGAEKNKTKGEWIVGAGLGYKF
nr:autotransporter outer membrane beta-barrel domain-containing protein [Fusobacterium ulcerans]